VLKKKYPTILEFIEALENETNVYRESIKIKYNKDTFSIEDCIRWTKRIVKDFEDRINK